MSNEPRHWLRLMRLGLTAIVLGGCQIELAAPPTAHITCDSEDECPRAMRCALEVGRCVSLAGEASQTPAFAEAPSLTGSPLRAGAHLRLSFTVNQPILTSPAVTLAGLARPLTRASDEHAAAQGRYTYEYVAAGDEPEGAVEILATLTDLAGNPVTLLAATAVFDFTAPEPQIATALGPTHVQVVFDEPVSVADTQHGEGLVVAPELTVIESGPGADPRIVVLLTARQAPGESYVLSISGVEDEAGNAVPAPGVAVPFTGFGEAPDRGPPEPLAPQEGGRARQLIAVLTWRAVTGASTYFVEVAEGMPGDETEAFATRALAGSPFAVDGLSTSLTVALPDAVTYLWRLRADVTADGVYSATRSFDAIADAVYVHCDAAASTCSDAGQVGSKTRPFRTIGRAIADAAVTPGVALVKVAGRGAGAAYEEAVQLPSGLRLEGGYAADFASRDALAFPTVINSAYSPVVAAYGTTTPTLLEGFVIRSSSADASATTLQIVGGGAELVVRDCTIDGAGAAAPMDSIAVRVDGAGGSEGGPRFERCTISGGEVDSGSSRALAMAGSTVVVDGGVVAGAGHESSCAIVVEGGELEVTGATVSAASAPSDAGPQHCALWVGGGGSARLEATSIEGGAWGNESRAIHCDHASLTLTASSVSGGAVPAGRITTAIHGVSCQLAIDTSSVQGAAVSGWSHALLLEAPSASEPGAAVIENATIHGGLLTTATMGGWRTYAIKSALHVTLDVRESRVEGGGCDGATAGATYGIHATGAMTLRRIIVRGGDVLGSASSSTFAVYHDSAGSIGNSVIAGGDNAAGPTTALRLTDGATTAVVSNVVYGGLAPTSTAVASVNGATPTLVNNVIFALGTTRYGIHEQWGEPVALRHNLLFHPNPDATSYVYRDSDGTLVTGTDDVELDTELAAHCAVAAGNIGIPSAAPVLDLAALFLDFHGALTPLDPGDDFAPASGSPVLDAGLNVYANPAYGDITDDMAGAPRPSCAASPCDTASPAWDIGPYQH